jgi:hypothetical protein
MLKIGIIAVGYQSKYIISSLAPWLELKYNTKKYTNLDLDIKICTCSALFKERWEAGETYNNDKNDEYLLNNKLIDKHIIVKHPIIDFESRNYCLEYLRQFNLDLIWQLDFGDEIYSINQIINIIKFINKNKFVDWFYINFKNFIGDENHYVEGFAPPRIHWFNKHGGVNKFVWDNDLVYIDGIHSNDSKISKLIIPKNIAHVIHYSWCGDKEFLIKKIEYQKKCLGTCSYQWNYNENKIEFNKDY